MDKVIIENKIKAGCSLKYIANELKCGYSTLRKYCKLNGLKANCIRINEKYPVGLIKKFAAESNSFTELLLKLKVIPTGASYQRVKEKIRENNIDVSHFDGKRVAIKKLNSYVKNNLNPISMERRVRRKKLFNLIKDDVEYKCNTCGIFEWNNKKLLLHIDHIDGNRYNNIKNNLQFLCPNCHSLKTYPDVT